MRNLVSSAQSLFKFVSKSCWTQWSQRLASSSSTMSSSPVYELRFYAMHPQHFKLANQMFEEKHTLRTKHSKLVGFWNSEVGDSITQLVHIWEYDSLSHRRKVRTAMTKDEVWNSEFVSILLPCIAQWKNSLLVKSPGSTLNLDFPKDPSAVYVLDQVQVDNYWQNSDPPEQHGEKLVGRFSGLLGSCMTEYRLWRYADINAVTESSLKRALETPYQGSSILMYPSKFSPLS